MTKFKDTKGIEFDAYKVYGVEERDANSMCILVDNEIINDRFTMSRDEYKKAPIHAGDYMMVMSNQSPKFINLNQLNLMIAPMAVPVAPDMPLTPVETPPATPVAAPIVKVTSGLSAKDGKSTSA